MDTLKDLYSFVNRFKLPEELQKYYIDPSWKTFDLKRDIKRLKCLLLRYENQSTGEEINTQIFLAILGYYLGEYKLTLFFIRKLEAQALEPQLVRLVLELKYNIRKLDKIVVLTSTTSTYLTSLNDVARYVNRRRPYNRKKLVIKAISTISLLQLEKYFQDFEQVFLVGHGNDTAMSLGDQVIAPVDILKFIEVQINKPNVLGILSCGNAFMETGIYNNVDYFITDNVISAQVFAEMFLYGYLRNFYSFYSVPKAVDAGRILPVIRAVYDIDIELYEKGVKTRP